MAIKQHSPQVAPGPQQNEADQAGLQGTRNAGLRGMSYDEGVAALAPGGPATQMKSGAATGPAALTPSKAKAALRWYRRRGRFEEAWVGPLASALNLPATVDEAFVQGIAAFQQSRGAAVDGMAGKNTRAKLAAANPQLSELDGWGPQATPLADEGKEESEKTEEKPGTSDLVTVDDLEKIGNGGEAKKEAKPASNKDEEKAEKPAPANDGLINALVTDKAKSDLAEPGTASADDNAWIHATGDFLSHPTMPETLKTAYKKCVKAARRGTLCFPGSDKKYKDSTPKRSSYLYRKFIAAYKKWMKDAFGQQEERVNKQIVAAGGRKMKAYYIKKYIESRKVNLPSEMGGKPVMDACATKFKEMYEAAAVDGVELFVLSGYRRPKLKKSKNPSAVASNSSHSYGLAIDLRLSVASEKFRVREIKTGDAKNLMKYYGSPVTKWMAVNGARFDFHPYANEPWHFEYNPAGMVNEIVAGAKAHGK